MDSEVRRRTAGKTSFLIAMSSVLAKNTLDEETELQMYDIITKPDAVISDDGSESYRMYHNIRWGWQTYTNERSRMKMCCTLGRLYDLFYLVQIFTYRSKRQLAVRKGLKMLFLLLALLAFLLVAIFVWGKEYLESSIRNSCFMLDMLCNSWPH